MLEHGVQSGVQLPDHRDRRPERGLGGNDVCARKLLRRDANDRVRDVVQLDGLAGDVRIAAIFALPELIAEHDDGVSSGGAVFVR
jgi:hypothetical protein